MTEENIPTEDAPQNLAEEFLDLLLYPERADTLRLRGDRPQLRVGYVPGIMPGKWFNRWHERYDSLCPLREIPLAEKKALEALTSQAQLPNYIQDEPTLGALAQMVLLRPEDEPASLDKDRFHSITLYREKQVVVLPQDHVLTVYEEEVPLAELAEEFMLQEAQTVPGWAEVSADFRASNPQKLPQMSHTKDAIELVAAGLGLLIVPMSIARFYHRKDLTYRIVPELEESLVNLVWKREFWEEDQEQIIQDFIGICRGRTAGSDRGSDSQQTRAEKAAREKEREKQKRRAANARRETRDRKARNAKKNGNARQYAAQSKRSGARGKKR